MTDPGLLGVMWFIRPLWPLTLVPPLIHFLSGGVLRFVAELVPSARPRSVVLIAVAINGIATLVENADGAGVTGAGWWLLGSLVSAALMLLGSAVASQAVRRMYGAESHR